MRLMWYAPFNLASEMSLAVAVSKLSPANLVVQSCSHDHGAQLSNVAEGDFDLVRDLPPPAGEMGERRSRVRQLQVLLQRAHRRERLIRFGEFDLIHLHTFSPYVDWWAIERLKKYTPWIVQSVHDVRPQEQRLPSSTETMLLRRGYQSCSSLIVAHDFLKDSLISSFGVEEQRIHVVPLPILNVPEVADGEPSHGGLPFNVLFFGTLRRNKGIPILLEAIALLGNRRDLRFVIAGGGDAQLEDDVRELAMHDSRVTAEIGFVSDQRRTELLGWSHVIAMPYTRFNSQSGVLSRDAYGSRRPVIVSQVGALARTVENDGSGWVLPALSAESLARTIEIAADSPDGYRQRVANIKKVASKRSNEAIADGIINVYRSHIRMS